MARCPVASAESPPRCPAPLTSSHTSQLVWGSPGPWHLVVLPQDGVGGHRAPSRHLHRGFQLLGPRQKCPRPCRNAGPRPADASGPLSCPELCLCFGSWWPGLPAPLLHSGCPGGQGPGLQAPSHPPHGSALGGQHTEGRVHFSFVLAVTNHKCLCLIVARVVYTVGSQVSSG